MREQVRRRLIVALVTAVVLPLGGTVVACGDTSGEDEYTTAIVAEDCSWPEDQDAREDDCGYWTKNGENRAGAQPDATWLWIWYTWVIIGRTSTPPPGWTPPRGVKFPSKTVRVNRKNCALGAFAPAPPPRPAPAPARPAAPQPGGAKPPANNNQPKAPQRPVYKPPAGQRVAC